MPENAQDMAKKPEALPTSSDAKAPATETKSAGDALRASVRGMSFAEGEAAMSPGGGAGAAVGGAAPKPAPMISFNGAPVDIATLDKGQCGAHLGRIIRIGKGVNTPDDAHYKYHSDALNLIKKRQEDIKGEEARQKEVADEADKQQVVAFLSGQLKALATSSTFSPEPPWMGKSVPAPSDSETYQNGPKPSAAIDAWKAFLGSGSYTNLDPHTGAPSPCRLTSADGMRAIRYSSHERDSSPNLHHYHEETYEFDGTSKLTILNRNKRMPINSAGRDKVFSWT